MAVALEGTVIQRFLEMKMTTPWMLIAGCSIFGFLIPESFVAFGKCTKVPFMMNVLSAVASGLIAASFV